MQIEIYINDKIFSNLNFKKVVILCEVFRIFEKIIPTQIMLIGIVKR